MECKIAVIPCVWYAVGRWQCLDMFPHVKIQPHTHTHSFARIDRKTDTILCALSPHPVNLFGWLENSRPKIVQFLLFLSTASINAHTKKCFYIHNTWPSTKMVSRHQVNRRDTNKRSIFNIKRVGRMWSTPKFVSHFVFSFFLLCNFNDRFCAGLLHEQVYCSAGESDRIMCMRIDSSNREVHSILDAKSQLRCNASKSTVFLF